MRKLLLASAALALIAAAPASASVTYNFMPSNPVGAGLTGFVELTNGAVQSERQQTLFNAPSNSSLQPPPGTVNRYLLDAPGLVDALFNFTNAYPANYMTTARYNYGVTDEAMERPFPYFSSGLNAAYNLRGTEDGLFGNIYYYNISDEMRVTFNGLTYTGSYGSDNGASGCFSAYCSFGGNISFDISNGNNGNGNGNGHGNGGAVHVPEPASMALFGMGLLGLGMVRRRKAV